MKRILPILWVVAGAGLGTLAIGQDAADPKLPAEAAPDAKALAEAPKEAAAEDPAVTEEVAEESEEDKQRLRADLLVRELTNDVYRKREEATAELWTLGEVAMDALEAGEKSDDPEVAFRSKTLLRRIRTGITPDTPQAVIDLVTKYFRSDVKGKATIFEELFTLKAYTQMLRLYRFETDELARSRCDSILSRAVLPAVRVEIRAGRLAQAEELLRLAPATDQNLRRRVALLRLEGKLDETEAEVRKEVEFDVDGNLVKRPKQMEAAAMYLAILRAKGDHAGARALAEKMDRPDLAAAMALFDGDPVPYLTLFAERQDRIPVLRIHAELALKRWQGDEAGAAKLAKSLAEVARGGGEEQDIALVALMLNGYLELARPIKERNDPESLFRYYDMIERPLKALEMVGYPAGEKERKTWIDERLGKLRKDWQDAEEARYDIYNVASFLEGRGEEEQARAIMSEVSEIAKAEGEEEWRQFIGYLKDRRSTAYVQLAFHLSSQRLGLDDEDGDAPMLIGILFGEGDSARRIWDLLEESEDIAASERLTLLGAIFGQVAVRPEILGPALTRLRAIADEEAELADKVEMLGDLLLAAELRDDAGGGLALVEELARLEGRDSQLPQLAEYYRFVGDAEKELEALAELVKENPDELTHAANYAGALFKAKRDQEAREQLRRVELDSLDEADRLFSIALILEQQGAQEEAERTWERMLLTSQPGSSLWFNFDYPAVSAYAEHCKRAKNWRVAAAFAEVDALHFARTGMTSSNPAYFARKRFSADLYRGLALLEEGDREEAGKLFQRSFRLLNGDASLADNYFPLLREAGMTEEHDRNFEIVYKRLEESIEAFPKAHNTYNSAAWIASRASRKLDDAQKKSETALEMRPRQAAYLDTMAEVWFAKRDREKATEWSRKAIMESYHGGHSSLSGGVELREQYERFRFGDFPAP